MDYLRKMEKPEIELLLNIHPKTYKTKDDILYEVAHNYFTRKFSPEVIFYLAEIVNNQS